MANIEKLRRAREAMSKLLSLTPSMWQDWAKDKAAIGSGPEILSTVEKLYEQGVFDYLVFYKSQQCTFSTLDEYVNLFLTRIDGLRRRLSCPIEGENALDYSLLRETFQGESSNHALVITGQLSWSWKILIERREFWSQVQVIEGQLRASG